MTQQTKQPLEDVPAEVKTLFSFVQTAEEAEELEHKDYVALYSDDNPEGPEQNRMIRLGQYDELTGNLRSNYFLVYDLEGGELGAQENRAKLNPDKTNSYPVKISEELYEAAINDLEDIF